MHKINKLQKPHIKKIKNIFFDYPKLHVLNNNRLYTLESNNDQLLRLDIVFKSGIDYQTINFQSYLSNRLFKAAPNNMSVDDCIEQFDYYGCFIDNFYSSFTAGYRVNIPIRFAENIIPLFSSIIKSPLLPENELDLYKKELYFKIQNNLQKTRYIASNQINMNLFGKNNPRAFEDKIEDISKISLSDIKDFTTRYYVSTNCYLMAIGGINNKILDLLYKNFNDYSSNSSTLFSSVLSIKKEESSNKYKFIDMPSTVQSTIYFAINLGDNLSDNEIIELNILSTILGGYFGSRLMKNIREEKGYTYGIQSYIRQYSDVSILVITADIGNQYHQATVTEVFNEINKLKQSKISQIELNIVKNYLLGSTLSELDGVFQSSFIWENLINFNSNFDFINNRIHIINTITSDKLLGLANKFLINDNFHVVIAGKQ